MAKLPASSQQGLFSELATSPRLQAKSVATSCSTTPRRRLPTEIWMRTPFRTLPWLIVAQTPWCFCVRFDMHATGFTPWSHLRCLVQPRLHKGHQQTNNLPATTCHAECKLRRPRSRSSPRCRCIMRALGMLSGADPCSGLPFKERI